MDYLDTVRPIYQGHLSTPTARTIRESDPGMFDGHEWLKTFVQVKTTKPESRIGDKPAPVDQARSPSFSNMILVVQLR